MNGKPKDIEIAGIRFHFEPYIEWEDAYKSLRANTSALAKDLAGPTHSTWGYTAEVGDYLIILHDYCPATDAGDFTVVPLKPKVKKGLG